MTGCLEQSYGGANTTTSSLASIQSIENETRTSPRGHLTRDTEERVHTNEMGKWFMPEDKGLNIPEAGTNTQ